VGLHVTHFKKTAPFEQGFNARPQATPKARPSVLSGLGELNALHQKGIKRFSVRNQATPTSWLNKPATPTSWLNKPATPSSWLNEPAPSRVGQISHRRPGTKITAIAPRISTSATKSGQCGTSPRKKLPDITPTTGMIMIDKLDTTGGKDFAKLNQAT